MLGTTINGLHIVEKLGEGGMAEVYRAVDLKLERDVAIKFLRATARDPEQQLKRFEIEAKALAKLRHPNIVTVLGYGEHANQPYLVMEYVPGGTLKDMLGQPMEPRKAAKLLAPIARALHYAHEKNIIHRDVKPSNILITESGEPMLSDFGVAKMLGLEETMDLTGTSVGIGTPYYMSPEQGRNREIGPQSDVYSLGVVLYEMVTGRKPYEAETPLAVILKHIEDPLPNLAEQVRGLPKDIERTIYAALAKKPAERFKSMHEMAEVLEQGKVGTAIRIRKPRSAAATKRYFWLGGAALGLIALALIIQNLGQRAAAQDPPDEQVSGLDQASTLVAGATATQGAELQATQAANFTATAQILAITREWRETLRLTPSATRGPTNTPAPTSSPTPVLSTAEILANLGIPLIITVGDYELTISGITKNESFTSTRFVGGLQTNKARVIQDGRLVLEEPINGQGYADGFAEIKVQNPRLDRAYLVIFMERSGADFHINYNNGLWGTDGYKSLWFGNGWDINDGGLRAGASVAEFRKDVDFGFISTDQWYAFFVYVDQDGRVFSKIWNMNNPTQVSDFTYTKDADWAKGLTGLDFGVPEGTVLLEHLLEIEVTVSE